MTQSKILSLAKPGAWKRPLAGSDRVVPANEDVLDLPAPRDDRHAGDRAFLPAALEILETPPAGLATIAGYAICGLIAAALLWSCVGRLTIYAIAPGMVQATGGTKVVEARQQGEVVAIRATNGDHVKAGDVLIELNPANALASETVIADKLTDLQAKIARWRVEVAAARTDTINPDRTIRWDPKIPQPVRRREEDVLHADLSQLAATLSELVARRQAEETARDGFSTSTVTQKALIALSAEHVAMHEQLAGKGVESRAVLLEAMVTLKQEQVALSALEARLADAAAAILVIDSALVKAREGFIANDAQQLASADRQADDLAQQLAKAKLSVTEMTLRAPIAGTVEASAVTTIGQVALAGQQLMQIVPPGVLLQIQAYVLNTDIGFVRTGQEATIKVDTFPYTRYGTIHGTVVQVANDAIPGKQALQQQKNASVAVTRGALSDTGATEHTGDLVFPVTVVPAASSIKVNGRDAPLKPGMSVVVEIRTTLQRGIYYILYPLVRGVQGPAER